MCGVSGGAVDRLEPNWIEFAAAAGAALRGMLAPRSARRAPGVPPGLQPGAGSGRRSLSSSGPLISEVPATTPLSTSQPPSEDAAEAAPGARGAPRRRDPARPTRVAVCGAGYIAEYHLLVLARTPGVELVCVMDVDADRARAAARERGVAHSATRVAELAELGVEVAHVLVPPDHHGTVTRELLEHGIGAFVEKPLVLSSEECRSLGELARERGVPLAVNHNAVFHPAFRRVLERARSGAIGRVEHVHVNLSVPLRQLDAGDFSHWMFRTPQNIVFEQATHPFSQVVELLGPVQELSARVLSTRELHPGQPFHDRWVVAARGERGTLDMHLAFGRDFTRSTLEVFGTDGSAEADLHHDLYAEERKTPWLDFWNSFLAGWRRGGALRRSARRNLFTYLRQTLGIGERGDAFWVGMRDSIQAFHGALREGTELPGDVARATQVIEWCERTVAELPEPEPPQPVPLSDIPPRAGEIVVLGANGFIGRHLMERLLADERHVTAVCRRRHSLPPPLPTAARYGRARLVLASLGDREALAAAIAGADTVIHLATGGGDTWEEVERSMVQGTRALGELCLEADVRRLIFVSSIAALYLGHDAGDGPLPDDTPTDPEPAARPVYARGKMAAEAALLRLHAERGLAVTIVRPGVVVGPGTPLQHSGLGLWARDNHCVGWGRGDRPVPLVLAADVADALARLAAHPSPELDGRTLNLAARTGMTAAEAVAFFRSETGRDFHFHPRSFVLSQGMEIGKWVVKRVGGRKDAAFPSYRDLKSRALHAALACDLARDVLGWAPCEDGEEILRRWLGSGSTPAP